MNNLDDRERQAFTVVDDALRTFPLSPVPATLYQSTMARVKATRHPQLFRLRWLDYALSLLAAIMTCLAIVLLQSISSETVESAKIEMQISLQQIDRALVWPLLLGSILLVVAIGALVAAFVRGPSIQAQRRVWNTFPRRAGVRYGQGDWRQRIDSE